MLATCFILSSIPDINFSSLGSSFFFFFFPMIPPVKFEFQGLEIVPEIIRVESQNHSKTVIIQPNGEAQQIQALRDNEFLGSLAEVKPPTPEMPPPEIPQAEEKVHHTFSPEEAKALGISEAIGPHHPTAKDHGAFEAWKARFKVPGK